MDLDKLMTIPFTWDKRRDLLELLSKEANVRFAIFCAESVLHIFEKEHPHDERPRKAIEVAKLYLEGKATEAECHAAAADAATSTAAYTAYTAAYTAYTAYTAAYTAYAAASAYAANAATYAANAATYAAVCDAGPLVKEQIMDSLRDLIISSLTEEQKENWLLVASL